MVAIKFHCEEIYNFKEGILANAFTYKDYSIEMHNHNFYEVNVIMSGTGTHCIEHGSYTVSAGDVFVIPPNVAHAYINTKKLEVYHILLQKKFIEQYFEEASKVNGFLQLIEIEPLLRSNSSEAFFLHLNQYELRQFKNEKDFIDKDGAFSWQDCTQMKYHAILKVLYWFSSLLIKQNQLQKEKSTAKYEIAIMNALEYIHTNYSEKITIETLCRLTFLSRSTFLRYFKETCGVSPTEYLNRFRCEKSIELLEKTNHSKTEIAHLCGFYDLSHMERMLKKYKLVS